MRYCGVDLSTRAIDLAFLESESNQAQWVRVPLDGPDAWSRILTISDAMQDSGASAALSEGLCLVAIEKPIPDQRGLLGNVLGAFSASLPKELRQPHRCWTVTPSSWKKPLGIHAHKKPTWEQIEALLPGLEVDMPRSVSWSVGLQDQWDALCIAAWARKTNEGRQ